MGGDVDGEGDRTLIVDCGPGEEWLDDYLRSAMLEGLTGRLADGSTPERVDVVTALAGWIHVIGQIDRAKLEA